MSIRAPSKRKAAERKKIEEAIKKYTPNNEVKIVKQRKTTRQENKYYKYMQSSAWLKTKRAQIYNDLGSSCEICSSSSNIEMHHNNYKYLFNEKPTRDIVVLCKDCHQRVHSKTPGNKLGKKPAKSKCNLCSNYGTNEKFYNYKSKYRDLKVCNCCHDALGNKINKMSLVEVKHPNKGLIKSTNTSMRENAVLVKKRKGQKTPRLSKFPKQFLSDTKILQKRLEKLQNVADLSALSPEQADSLQELRDSLNTFCIFFK